jgi:hypothetical protein
LLLSLLTSGPAAIADAIKDMGALSSANLLRNSISVEQAQELVKIMRAKKNLTTCCGLSGEEAELDFSGQDLGAGDAVLIANDISDMGALTSLNLSSNSIGAQWKQGKMVVTPEGIFVVVVTFGSHVVFYVGPVAIADAIRDTGALTSLNLASNNLGEPVLPDGWSIKDKGMSCEKYVHADGREQKDHPSKPEGVIALANAIPNMRALSKLVMRENGIHGAEAGRAFADMLAQNTVLKELDLSSQKVGTFGKALDALFAKEFAVGISGNGALTRLDISKNELFHDDGAPAGKSISDMLAVNSTLRELDVSGNAEHSWSKGGLSFAQALSVGISDNRALTSLDISKNDIGADWDGSKWASTPEGSCLSLNNATSLICPLYG